MAFRSFETQNTTKEQDSRTLSACAQLGSRDCAGSFRRRGHFAPRRSPLRQQNPSLKVRKMYENVSLSDMN